MSVLKQLPKRFLEKLLDRRGYVLKEKSAPPRGFDEFLALYRRSAETPKTIIDIGVGRGTPWLYDAFPEAELILIEALEVFRPQIDQLLQKRRGVCHYCALSESDGEITIHIPVNQPTGASILPRSAAWAERKARQGDPGTQVATVPVRRLDALLGDVKGPYAVKIDVEGAELKVISGGERTIRGADLVIVEASVATRHQGESDLIDIAQTLKGLGFRLFDIVEMSTLGPEGGLAYVDAAFVRSGKMDRQLNPD